MGVLNLYVYLLHETKLFLRAKALSFEGVDAIFFGIGAQVDPSTEKSCDEILVALKYICCIHGKDVKVNRAEMSTEQADEEETEYIELSFGAGELI